MTSDRSAKVKLYHIRLINTYLEYIQKNYPDIDIDEILDYAGLSRYELDDMGFWFTQEQSDRFYEIVREKTGNPDIAREAGRMEATSKSYDAVRQYVYGFLTPGVAYGLVESIGNKVTRGGYFKTRKLASNRYEISAYPSNGVEEKPYQCENRFGLFEAIAEPFTGEFATIEHTECLHRGGEFCRYIISWEEPSFLVWKRVRNYISLLGPLLCLALSFFIPSTWLFLTVIACLSAVFGITAYAWHLEKQGLSEKVENQSQSAELLLKETSKRFNEAQLVQEIGKTISSVLDIDELLERVMMTLEKHLDYNRGMVLLGNEEKTRLVYRAGYGFESDQERYFSRIRLHLDNPASKGPLVLAYKEQKPYLIDNVEEISSDLSARSKDLVDLTGTHSFICVPIVYENESLGVLCVVNMNSAAHPRQSDLNLLMGVAPQIAISINNARFFEKLHASEEKYRVLVESANSIILRLDPKGKITFLNKYAQEFYGYTEDEILGRNALGMIVPITDSSGGDLSSLYGEFLRNPDRHDHFESESVRRLGEKVWVSWSNTAIYDKDSQVSEILAVGHDITERRKAEQDKKRLELQLQRSQKMEAIGTLAGGVAHDLNNILSGIVSYPEILLMEVPEGSPMRKSLEVIKRSGEKAAAIVQDLLTLARRGVNVSNVLNLNPIVQEYFRSPEYSKLAQYHPLVRADFRLEDKLLNILGSSVHLSKTLMNLVSNAAEAMPDGGTITVSTRNQYVETPIRGFDTIEEGEYAVLSVEDSGIGISPEDVKRIFEPFYSKKVMGRSGTGLGMAVIWSTVKDHQGFIDVDTELGTGTRFELYFPVTRLEMEVQDSKQPLSTFSGTEKILVIDDVQDQREIAQQFLQKLGYRVDVVASGEEALEYMQTQKADLLLLDMIMDPGMDGHETYRKILEIHKGQKAIIVSGYSESDRVKGTLSLGAGSYVKKPYILHDIAKAVRTELDRKEP